VYLGREKREAYVKSTLERKNGKKVCFGKSERRVCGRKETEIESVEKRCRMPFWLL
jgi:hypothetical protein